MKHFALFAVSVTCLAATAPHALAQGADPLDPILACRSIGEDAERLACFDAAASALGGEDEAGEIVVVRREQIEQVERESFGFSVPGMSSLAEAMAGMFPAEPSAPEPHHAAMDVSEPQRTEPARSEPVETPAARADTAPQPQSAEAPGADAGARAEEATGVSVQERNNSGEATVVVMAIERYHEFDYQRGRFHMENGQVWEQTETQRMRMPRNSDAFAHIRRLTMGGYVLSINDRGARTDVRRIR
ncbi:MAG: hypothetical protein RKE49_15355 [Oceanicaulis sp.]